MNETENDPDLERIAAQIVDDEGLADADPSDPLQVASRRPAAIAVKLEELTRMCDEMRAGFEAAIELTEGEFKEKLQYLGVDPINEESEFLREQLGFTNEQMDHLYKLGFERFEEKDFEPAIKLFRLLVHLEPRVGGYWIALGRTLESADQKGEAVKAYMQAVEVEPENLLAYEYAMHCCMEANLDTDLSRLLDLAMGVESDEFAPLQEAIKQLSQGEDDHEPNE